MMITIEFQTLYLLLISNAVLLIAVCLSISGFERHRKAVEKYQSSPTGFILSEKVDEESSDQLQIARQLGERVGELQETVKSMEAKSPKSRLQVERSLPIENAQRMARLGASIDELTKGCGLNIGEARLIQKLHGRPKAIAQEAQAHG